MQSTKKENEKSIASTTPAKIKAITNKAQIDKNAYSELSWFLHKLNVEFCTVVMFEPYPYVCSSHA